MNSSLSTLSLERLSNMNMKIGDIILWNGKPHTFDGYRMNNVNLHYGRPQFEAILSEVVGEWDYPITFCVFVKDAFNKMEHQILTTI